MPEQLRQRYNKPSSSSLAASFEDEETAYALKKDEPKEHGNKCNWKKIILTLCTLLAVSCCLLVLLGWWWYSKVLHEVMLESEDFPERHKEKMARMLETEDFLERHKEKMAARKLYRDERIDTLLEKKKMMDKINEIRRHNSLDRSRDFD